MKDKEEKDLLIKDLSARIPYGVKGQCEIDASYDTSFGTVSQTHKFDAIVCGLKGELLFVTPLIEDKDELEVAKEEVAEGINILDFKPYLFPFESMTKEQESYIHFNTKFRLDCCNDFTVKIDEDDNYFYTDTSDYRSLMDWLRKNHFDIYDMIPKGFANNATNLNIY